MSENEQHRAGPDPGASAQRLDKWLWFARVVKSRTLAASLITEGKVRVNRVKADKPSQTIRPGDVVTSSIKRHVRVLRVLALGVRRGPAQEAARLYEDLSPPAIRIAEIASGPMPPPGTRTPGAGRPTKKDRRSIDRFTGE